MTDHIPTAPTAATQADGPAFSTLALAPTVLANLDQLGYRQMTTIQAASLPIGLAGHDLIAQAKTGSGKTVAFTLHLLQRLETNRLDVQALVLCPTRELAEQVSGEIRRLARSEANTRVLTLCGGSPAKPQRASLAHGAHVVVGTPGRVLDHLQTGSLSLTALRTLVVDEADRMLDMGFHDDMVAVVSACPVERQTLLFSATYPDGIARIAQRFLRAPRMVRLVEQHAPTKIRQRFHVVPLPQRPAAVVTLLRHYRPVSTLAFCNTRQQCRDLVEALQAAGIVALALHGELEQRERDQVLVQFAQRSCSVLVATDVAARGLDIAGLEAVINVELSPDPEVHLHRIGRTGRADAEGWALSLVGENEKHRVASLAEAQGFEAEWQMLDTLEGDESPLLPPMATLQILGGRKDKIRAGDVLGALTGAADLQRDDVGKISVLELSTYVAVRREHADIALRALNEGRLKGRKVRVRRL